MLVSDEHDIADCCVAKGNVLRRIISGAQFGPSPTKRAKVGNEATATAKRRKVLGAYFNRKRRNFFLFGHPIGAPPSPLLHNTGFQALGLPHMYDKLDTGVTFVHLHVGVHCDHFINVCFQTTIQR